MICASSSLWPAEKVLGAPMNGISEQWKTLADTQFGTLPTRGCPCFCFSTVIFLVSFNVGDCENEAGITLKAKLFARNFLLSMYLGF